MGWYILAQTNSVVMLTLVGAFRFLGTLLSPWFGVAGDRFGRRGMMLYMRGALMALAAIIMVLALLDILMPIHVLTVAFLAGLIQPSDILMRNALVGDTIPQPRILGAISISRTAHASARRITPRHVAAARHRPRHVSTCPALAKARHHTEGV